MGSNIFVVFTHEKDLTMFATPTYAAAVECLCTDAATTRKNIYPQYLGDITPGNSKTKYSPSALKL